VHEVIEGAVARFAIVLLVVVSEFDEHIVARLEVARHMRQTLAGDETLSGLTTFGIVAHRHLIVEKLGEELSPRAVGFELLVGHGAVATEIDDRHLHRFDTDLLDAGGFASELEGQLIVPIEFLRLPRFEVDAIWFSLGIHEVGSVFINHESVGRCLPLGGSLTVHEGTAALTAHGGDASPFPAP